MLRTNFVNSRPSAYDAPVAAKTEGEPKRVQAGARLKMVSRRHREGAMQTGVSLKMLDQEQVVFGAHQCGDEDAAVVGGGGEHV
jgi:hypothetical protein